MCFADRFVARAPAHRCEQIQQGAMEALSRRAERWPFVSGIADVYLQLHASLLDLYIDYATNFDNSQTAFVRMKTENPAFAKLVAEVHHIWNKQLGTCQLS